MNKKGLTILTAAALCLSMLLGCAAGKTYNVVPAAEPARPEQLGAGTDATPTTDAADFDELLIDYLRTHDFGEKNFTVSPLSLRAALALAAAGAEGETERELLSVLGFPSQEEMDAWYRSVTEAIASFDACFDDEQAQDNAAFRVVNSVWQNADLPGEFLAAYRERIGARYAAQAEARNAAELTQAINDWVKAQTNGLIPQIVADASQADAVLVNALYLKTAWLDEFHNSSLHSFTDRNGNTVEKDFINIVETYDYYSDEACSFVVLPLQGGIRMLVLLGDGEGLKDKLPLAESTQVNVTIPKFDVETSYEQQELCTFLTEAGCAEMFSDNADFSAMFDRQLSVSDILQKAKVHVDQNGLEAAAATAIVMTKGARPMQNEPVEFTADRPFQFYIFCGDTTAPELLFFGQIVE